MKNKIKFLVLFLMGALAITSCNKDDDETSDVFTENKNESYFSGLEIGTKDFIVPQSNADIHVEFDYEGKSKVSKIFIDIISKDIKPIKGNEIDYKLEKHLVSSEKHVGSLNAHIHHHIYYDNSEKNKYTPENIPAEGTYLFKVTVEHEDNSKSFITKEFQIIKKIKNINAEDFNSVSFGDKDLHTEFDYVSGENTVSSIKYYLWFKEWREGKLRDGKEVKIGGWNNIERILPKNLYEGTKNPHIHYHMDLPEGLPAGRCSLIVHITEKTVEGEDINLKIYLRFIVK